MTEITIAWIALSFFIGLVIYLLPKLDSYLTLGMALVFAGYASGYFMLRSPLEI